MVCMNMKSYFITKEMSRMIRKISKPSYIAFFVPEIRTQSLPNETCSPTDYIRLNPTKSLVDAYLCTDGKPAKTGLEYYKKTGVQTSSLYKSPEEHYVDYFQNRDPRMKMTLYAPGDKW